MLLHYWSMLTSCLIWLLDWKSYFTLLKCRKLSEVYLEESKHRDTTCHEKRAEVLRNGIVHTIDKGSHKHNWQPTDKTMRPQCFQIIKVQEICSRWLYEKKWNRVETTNCNSTWNHLWWFSQHLCRIADVLQGDNTTRWPNGIWNTGAPVRCDWSLCTLLIRPQP